MKNKTKRTNLKEERKGRNKGGKKSKNKKEKGKKEIIHKENILSLFVAGRQTDRHVWKTIGTQ